MEPLQRIGMRHHHGIALPLISLRQTSQQAVGQFLDLIPVIKWCASVNFDVIQLLPLNDSGHDSSPYSAHTAMGLNPIYLSLENSEIDDGRFAQDRVPYRQVLDAKMAILRKMYEEGFSRVQNTATYKAFSQQEWVQEYALYKSLKQINHEAPWWQWEDVKTVQDSAEMHFHIYTQFLCFEQWKKVRECADHYGVFLKGDIPILINRDSADVWLHRDLFMLNYSAGAPPDMYNEEGQHWGFPLYNWNALEEQKFAWWRRRLELAEKLYHIYRLDHIVGFFRIWSIPDGKKPKEGSFIPHDESEWIPQGKKILQELLSASGMLPIGEDLGAVPQDVRACMKELGIPGTKVLRWERRWETDKSFIDPYTFEPLSMSTVSTHDSETLAEWWEKFRDESGQLATQLEIEHSPKLTKEIRKRLLTDCHASKSLFHINLLQEYLGMFDELAWKNPEDDRINLPGVVRDSNWTYRFKPTIAEITTHKGLFSLMREFSRWEN